MCIIYISPKLDNCPREDGMDPFNRLKGRYISYKFVKSPNSDGIGPCN